MLLQVEIDEPRCVAAGHCVVAAPEVFDQRDDDGVVILLDANPPGDEHERVREAALLCPAAAILVRDRGGAP
ncbi:ferredoxin [Umezawaea tangerina]|uniref:Ferredoxin n=1 Tax=Umezawaea tangerina TaxID=84725 RepID=A0A2T0T0B0_9PSEU|nr:ferredoxin [Umezawaea tangerina]PRY39096.1 ferredoxin [Umezawaea tangerina]